MSDTVVVEPVSDTVVVVPVTVVVVFVPVSDTVVVVVLLDTGVVGVSGLSTMIRPSIGMIFFVTSTLLPFEAKRSLILRAISVPGTAFSPTL